MNGSRRTGEPGAKKRTTICFIGFGDLASRWADELGAQPGVRISAYLRPGSAARRGATVDRARSAGVTATTDLAEAVCDADIVIAAVPASAAAEVAVMSAAGMQRDTLYIDPSSGSPQSKAEIAALLAGHGICYVDVAVLGTATLSGLAVPLLAAGPAAHRFSNEATRLGMNVTIVGHEPGDAVRVKLIRSVYMKGRDALLVEMLLAAHRRGIERDVVESIAGAPGENVPFDQLATRVLVALTRHAERRADELASSASELRTLGVEPVMADAAERRLRWLAALPLRDLLAGQEPSNATDVLAAIESLAGIAPPRPRTT